MIGINIAVVKLMSRLPRSLFPISGYYHVICRGNNRSVLFYEDGDFVVFIRIVRKFKDEWPFKILHHCIMPTHVHFLIEVENLKYLSKAIQSIELSYCRYFTQKYNYTGHLWHGRFRSIPITSEDYLFACGRYIELNAVSAGISSIPENYEWCSYRYYVLGKDDFLVTPAEWFMGLSNSSLERKKIYKNFIYEKINCNDEEESNIFERTLLIGDVSAVDAGRVRFCGKKVRKLACDNDLPQKRPQKETSPKIMRRQFLTLLIAFILPVEGWISSPYGLRADPFTRHWAFHRGVDIANHYASAVKATDGGVVTFAGKKAGYGRLAILEHKNGLQTYYGHLGRIFVGAGDSVAAGQLVGWMGMTGRATGAHVHYEMRRGGVAVNPLNVQSFKFQVSSSNVPTPAPSNVEGFQLENFWALLNENIFPPML